jgi:hypothetical protein
MDFLRTPSKIFYTQLKNGSPKNSSGLDQIICESDAVGLYIIGNGYMIGCYMLLYTMATQKIIISKTGHKSFFDWMKTFF